MIIVEYIHKSRRRATIVLCVLFLIALISIIYNIHQSQEISELKNPQAFAQAQVQSVVAQLSKFMILPTDETPTLATVSDPSKLKDQPFFADAEVGDEVIIYANAQKAILWRPSEQKIVLSLNGT